MTSRHLSLLLLVAAPLSTHGQASKSVYALPQESEAATRAFPAQLRSELAKLRDAALADGQAGAAYGEAVKYRGSGGVAAAEQGAVASLVRSVGGAEYRLPHTGWSTDAHIPAGAIAAEDADLIALLASQGAVRMHLTL